MMLFTDKNELKRILEIDPANTQEDIRLNFYIEQASEWIHEYLNRPDIEYKQRTWYYQGTKTQFLTLRHRPVFPAPGITVVIDQNGYFGEGPGAFTSDGTSQTLVYGQDYILKLDSDSNGDGIMDSSRCGTLIRINDYWPQLFARQTGLLSPFITADTGSVQVTYTAGYTVDKLPAQLRFACNLLIARMRYIFPLGMEITQESYEDRSVGFAAERKDYLMALVKPMLCTFRNWKWG